MKLSIRYKKVNSGIEIFIVLALFNKIFDVFS